MSRAGALPGERSNEATATDARSRGVLGILGRDRALVVILLMFVACAPLVTQRIYASDEIQYFAYTHSLFFDQDLDFSNQYLHFCNLDKVKFADFCRDLYGKHEPATGLPINVAPIGTGLFWMPSFALTHLGVLLARSLGARVAADGYSQPYITAICYTSYLYACAGLLLCYFLVRRYFGSKVSAASVLLGWLATPVIFYMVIAPPWSHATSLLAVTAFICLWHFTRRGTGRTTREWIWLGVSAGVMMLVREQDALFLSIPFIELACGIFLWRVRRGNYSEQLTRHPDLRGLVPDIKGVVIMLVCAGVMFIPQLLAYRVITGHFGPSKVVSSKFTWTSPNFFNVLFSPEHGLLPWSPVIALALCGLVLAWRNDRILTGALAVAFLLQLYVAGSFLTWQSAGSFGQRRFINSTAIFVFGLGAVGSWALAHGVPRWLALTVAAAAVAWNGGLLMQYALWCSPQRQGLDWALVLKGQLEMPAKAGSLIWDYITNRQVFYRRTKGC